MKMRNGNTIRLGDFSDFPTRNECFDWEILLSTLQQNDLQLEMFSDKREQLPQ